LRQVRHVLLAAMLGVAAWSLAEFSAVQPVFGQDTKRRGVNIFGVDIFLTESSGCRKIGARNEIRVDGIGAFRSEVPIGDVVAKLVQRAHGLEANTLESIRLIPHGLIGGTSAIASAVKCLDEARVENPGTSLDPLLASIVENAEVVRVNSFLLEAPSPERSVASKIAAKRVDWKFDLDQSGKARLVSLITMPKSYLPDWGVQGSCQFEPSTGFQFTASNGEAWWLVSSCGTALLVRLEDDWRRLRPLSLTSETLQAMRELTAQSQR
jgi:hypothetical protein